MNITKTILPTSPCYLEGRTPFISFHLLNGEAVAINQAHIDRILYHPNEGITVKNGKQGLMITGINLQPLFEAMGAGQITTIRAVDPTAHNLVRGKIWVEKIAYTSKAKKAANTEAQDVSV